MLKPQILASDNVRSLFITGSFIIASGETKLLPVRSIPTPPLHKARRAGRIFAISSKPTRTLNVEEKDISVKAKVTVKLTVGGLLSDIGVNRGIDDFTDLLGKSLLLELISSELDPKTGSEKELVKAYAHKIGKNEGTVTYEGDFKVKVGFGEVGGVYVTNMHHKAMHLLDIVITGFPNGPVNISCNSWIHPVDEGKPKRIFFTSKSYLPEDTPKGLLRLRAEELEVLRGNGQGERKRGERIYDYDTYNDLGNPDKSIDLARPVLGGPNHPYPRRCRTGRPRTRKDPSSESRVDKVYVPRDEEFSEVKQIDFSAKTLKSLLHSLIPSLETSVVDKKLGFPYFTAIDSLFNEGVSLQNVKGKGIFQLLLPRLVKAIADGGDDLLLFEIPQIIDRDKFSWFRDEEFGRQTLAGLNPFSIQLVTEFPFVSKLDPKIYGSPDSLITKEIIEREIKGIMTAEEAIKQKKIFVLDYHDIFLPYVHKVRQLEETTLYGSRTVFFLTHVGTLMPIAIELTRPKSPTVPQWRQVFTPGIDATSCWLWKLAKCHVCAHDSGYHQLVVHWLRTHCCVEPYIIAARRQLSEMHPICRLLHPHFRYTMEINALARESLINAGGIIENCFAPGKYSIELSSVAYDKFWRFDMESLPADLIRRGMAVEDPDSEYGIKLTIEDYPFANDGLLLWSEIKQWVTDYVTHYYSDDNKVANDNELQSWWTEVRTKGHADKKNEPWWPVINSIDSLIQVLSTIIWITSGHHAAVNFGQYPYAGYFPNRPTICRTNMPVEKGENEAFQRFLRKPESVLLECFPSQIQATRVMSILDVLSNHSPEEEYIGTSAEISWADEPVINAAFERFCGKMKEMEGIIDQRNTDLNLRNRTGAGVLSYELLKPFSKPGVTGMGVPNSISI